MAVYQIHSGHYREALINLEVALKLDYDAHVQLFDVFPDLEKQFYAANNLLTICSYID